MNTPINFGKLDREFVELYGNKFTFEVIQIGRAHV